MRLQGRLCDKITFEELRRCALYERRISILVDMRWNRPCVDTKVSQPRMGESPTNTASNQSEPPVHTKERVVTVLYEYGFRLRLIARCNMFMGQNQPS